MSMPESVVAALLRSASSHFEGEALRALVVRRLEASLPRELLPAVSRPLAETYGRYVVHRDPDGLFSLVVLALAFGQSTPIHDHTTWGVITILAGCEREVRYDALPSGRLVRSSTVLNGVGVVSKIDQPLDLHRVEGACPRGGVTLSLHVYGCDADDVLGDTYERVSLPFEVARTADAGQARA